ncbi:MAG: S8 family serine peptidase [Clostridia bacterium]|nr:S8 family serine peptidase [Clostridia bacterium]
MKVKKFLSFLMCIVMVCTLMPVYSLALDVEVIEPDVNSNVAEFAENQIVFLYTQKVNSKNDFCKEGNVSQELLDCGITSLEEIPANAIYDTSVKKNADGTFTKSTLFTGYTNIGAEKCLAKVKALASVSDADLCYYFQGDSFTMPKEITNPVSTYLNYTKWWMEDSVHIPEAWEAHETMGAGTVIAVIDSGVFVNNPEVSANIWEDAYGHRGYNAETRSYDAAPITSHGSNVVGIIAASANKNTNLIGVAPETKVMPINVSQTASNISVTSVITGINYAIENGADIITMSLSTTSDMATVKAACEAAYNAGITVISSAGNNKTSTATQKSYPAAYNCVIGVMAYGKDNNLCNFSNYDPSRNYYDVAAPGYQILGLPMSDQFDTMTIVSGTSQATPIVAGLAALYYSIYPDHTPEEFKTALINSSTETVGANPTVTSANYTFRKVNAVNLLNYYDEAIPTVEAFPGTPTVIDDENNFIYGLEENYESIDDYVSVSNGDCEFIPTENGNGTGSILRVYTLSGSVYKDYEIVVFGDTDGDAICNGMDSLFCQYVLDGGDISDAVSFACDVNFDNEVTETDLEIINACGLKMNFVTQIR